MLSLMGAEKSLFHVQWMKYTKDIVIYLSLDFQIIDFNPAAEKLINLKKESALGENFINLCQLLAIESPLPLKKMDELLEILPQTDIETYLEHNSRYLSWSIFAINDDENNAQGLMLIAQDVTKLKTTEVALLNAHEMAQTTNEALASLNKFVTGQTFNDLQPTFEYAKGIYDYLENIIAAMPGSVYWMNRQGIYLGCNDNMAKIFGLKSRNDMLGKTYEDLYDKKSGDLYRAADTEVMNSGIPKVLEEPLYNLDGTITILSLSSKVPLRDKTGIVIGMLGISIDITERKNVELALKEAKDRAESANLAKSEFIGVISHEFRIPLTGILGMAKLLIMQDLSVEKQKEYINHIFSAGMHLLNLINDTLDFAKLEAGKFELAIAPMDLCLLVEETCTILTPLSKAKNLELLIHFDATVPNQILGDKRILRQILINLVGNAIKFTEQGYVSIQIECIEKTENNALLVLSVSDTGIGIPEDKQGIIFDHFTQVDASHSRPYGGAGLGLTITKLLVEMMNGSIGVTSQIGKGSTFRCVIDFPLQVAATLPSPWLPYQSTVKILIVDDTPRGEILRKQISLASQVVSSREALNTVLVSHQLSDLYDIIIVNQKLEGMNAFVLAREIQKYNDLQKVMLVLLIEEGSINTIEMAKSAGYFECIVKPVRPLALQITLTAAWERWIEQRTQ